MAKPRRYRMKKNLVVMRDVIVVKVKEKPPKDHHQRRTVIVSRWRNIAIPDSKYVPVGIIKGQGLRGSQGPDRRYSSND